ncbi:hypothetical protein [Psychrilyobacter atlanticus]|uniref:hypothetical protein n=1 Tax=Psychrilyobacter atlanticus TaxID=271091 RepID=UPI000409DEFF|nr:hypothetical protein [Psychrilyobacter atlanticus]
MKLKDKVKIECLKKGVTMADLAREIGITRHNYYFHLNKENEVIVRKTEKILELEDGFFK